MVGKIRIETAKHPKDWRIFLDGIDISHFVSGIEIIANIHGSTRVVLYCKGDLDIDGDI